MYSPRDPFQSGKPTKRQDQRFAGNTAGGTGAPKGGLVEGARRFRMNQAQLVKPTAASRSDTSLIAKHSGPPATPTDEAPQQRQSDAPQSVEQALRSLIADDRYRTEGPDGDRFRDTVTEAFRQAYPGEYVPGSWGRLPNGDRIPPSTTVGYLEWLFHTRMGEGTPPYVMSIAQQEEPAPNRNLRTEPIAEPDSDISGGRKTKVARPPIDRDVAPSDETPDREEDEDLRPALGKLGIEPPEMPDLFTLEDYEAALARVRESWAEYRPGEGDPPPIPESELERIAMLDHLSNGGISAEEMAELLFHAEGAAETQGEEQVWRHLADLALQRGTLPDDTLWQAGRGRRSIRGQPTDVFVRDQNVRIMEGRIHEFLPGYRYSGRGNSAFGPDDYLHLQGVLASLSDATRWRRTLSEVAPNVELPDLTENNAREQSEYIQILLANTPSFDGGDRDIVNPHFAGFLAAPRVQDYRLRRIFGDLFRTSDNLPGGTAAMLRFEADQIAEGQRPELYEMGENGRLVASDHRTHLEKARSNARRIDRLIRNNYFLPRADRQAAEAVLRDLREAVRYFETIVAPRMD